MTSPAEAAAVAVVVARDGRLPAGASDAVAEADGTVVVVGHGAEEAARALVAKGAVAAWWSDTGPGLRPAGLARSLALLLRPVTLVILPASPDGRDLAPRLAAELGRPCLAGALRTTLVARPESPRRAEALAVTADVARLDDRVLVPVEVDGPAVVTVAPRGGSPARPAPAVGTAPVGDPGPASVRPLGPLPEGADPAPLDPELLAVLEPDPRTMDLADATRVLAGGAGLAAGLDQDGARDVFDLLSAVAAELGASAGATRVATDAGWTGYERQIGTTGVAVDPHLYVAFGISGAAQHVGGLGAPDAIVSVNTDNSTPMTAMADLGLVTDARGLLVELADRLGVPVAGDLRSTAAGDVGTNGKETNGATRA